MAKQEKYKCPGRRLFCNEDRKIKGYLNYVIAGLRQLFHIVQLGDLNIEHNSRLARFFESKYYYVLWEYRSALYYCTKDQAMKVINEMGHPDEYQSYDITIVGEDFENSDILCFNHDNEIYFYEKCGRLEVLLD